MRANSSAGKAQVDLRGGAGVGPLVAGCGVAYKRELGTSLGSLMQNHPYTSSSRPRLPFAPDDAAEC